MLEISAAQNYTWEVRAIVFVDLNGQDGSLLDNEVGGGCFYWYIPRRLENMGFTFTTTHNGETDKLGLASELERFANCQWIGDHYTLEQASSLVMDRFRKMIEQQLELIELHVERE